MIYGKGEGLTYDKGDMTEVAMTRETSSGKNWEVNVLGKSKLTGKFPSWSACRKRSVWGNKPKPAADLIPAWGVQALPCKGTPCLLVGLLIVLIRTVMLSYSGGFQ